MKIALLTVPLGFACLFFSTPIAHAAEPPHIHMVHGTGQLIVNGRPFLILGGELGNSSSANAAQADAIIPKLASMHINTILTPVTWEQLEPKEGNFDFSILDHWIEVARAHKMHLVLLWFGSWKNAFSNYAPAWVKSEPKRFPRAESADGRPLEILSTLSPETRRCDSRAFAELLRHVREKDSDQQTVLMVQAENEVGYLGQGRDRSPEANRLFRGRVPDVLLRSFSHLWTLDHRTTPQRRPNQSGPPTVNGCQAPAHLPRAPLFHRLGTLPYGFRVAVHRPSARPSIFMRPLAESPSNHPASVATAGATVPLSSSGQSTLKLSST